MEDLGRDFISNLPSDILKNILSLLPLEEAVRTSAFSNSWRTLWLPDLVTCHGLEAEEELKQIIALLSKSYDTHKKWKLLCSSSSHLEITNGDEKVIALATKGVEQELHLEFPKIDKEFLSNFHLKLKTASPSFSTLKTLRIKSVNSLCKNLISGLFSSSKFLESLELENCSGLLSLDIEANDSLESLKLLNFPDLVNIKVSARNLRTFWYQGVVPIQLQNCLDLVEVKFDLRNGFRFGEFDCEDVINFLASLKEIQILTISSCLLECLCQGGVIFSRLGFKFNKLKELCWKMDSNMNKTKRDTLACFLNICPSLEKLLIKIDDAGVNSVECPYFFQYWHEPHLWMDDETVKSNTFQLENLKIVEFWGYKSEEDEFLLIKLLLDKANMLESVTVTSPDNHSWEIARIPQPPQLIPQTNTKLISNLRLRQKKNAVFSLFKCFFLELLKEINVGFCPENAGCDMSFWF